MAEKREHSEYRGARLRIFGTNPDNPEDGRIFLWTKVGWFERIEGRLGEVAFTPVAQSEVELRKFIARGDPSVDLVMLGREYRKIVSEEFKWYNYMATRWGLTARYHRYIILFTQAMRHRTTSLRIEMGNPN